MKRLIALMALLLCAASVDAVDVRTYIPEQAAALLPELRTIQKSIWDDAPMPSFLAAQIEQESCISLTHSKCWNPHAELKTSREYGFGLGQTTVAYNADGSTRFNKFEELKRQYASLRGWTWSARFDAKYQMTALVEMDRGIYKRVQIFQTPLDRLAFTLSAYNGGESGLRQDQLLCRNRSDCDPSRWFGNVEKYSLKSRQKFKGYGQAPFDINREYVSNVIYLRRPKYEKFFRN